ncbi:rod shape-determining protein MreC [Lentibacillus amyloliquefaciens]|uniref:Cell shape-determining protein MreC n=1 Tax=Lentibacillus amyloliquefaciens TaxID=1472767 RepID=A0A0U3WEJ4_9BACI|nr:rod shape-determining protein MreC [Lentibacillus amyloliquefaciens]ALX48207.1 rod shape-determining protein MreC [Lentibacillus amyloliquefaciens]
MRVFPRKRLFILLIGIIILVGLIGYSLQDRENETIVEQFVKDTVGWAQNLVHTPVDYVTGIFENIDDIKNTYEENKILRENIAEYKSLQYEVQELKEENEELRNTIDKTESIRDYNPVQATVISRSPERWIEQVTINKGSQDGVEENMAVITADGMIGKVESESKFTSSVKLLTGFDQFNRISAKVSREGDDDVIGMIEGYDQETNQLMFRVVEESDFDLEEGELVLSSGMGGVFPAGLPIGEVKEVKPDEYGLTRTAFVEPVADMYDINNVIVVERQGPDNDASGESEEAES